MGFKPTKSERSVINGVGAGGFQDAAITAVTAFMVPAATTAVTATGVIAVGRNQKVFCLTSAASEMEPPFCRTLSGNADLARRVSV